MTLFLNKREEQKLELDQEAQQTQRQNHLKAAEFLARASGCHKDAAMYCALGNVQNAKKNSEMASAHIAKAMEYATGANRDI